MNIGFYPIHIFSFCFYD